MNQLIPLTNKAVGFKDGDGKYHALVDATIKPHGHIPGMYQVTVTLPDSTVRNLTIHRQQFVYANK